MSRSRTELIESMKNTLEQLQFEELFGAYKQTNQAHLHKGGFRDDEARWILFMRETLIDLAQYVENHASDEVVKVLYPQLVRQLNAYLEHRAQSDGVRRKFGEIYDSFQRDGARFAVIDELINRGCSLNRAAEKAADLLIENEHPAGMNKKGEPLDASTMKAAYLRFKKTNLPTSLWAMPGMEKMPPLPEIPGEYGGG